MAHRRRLAGGNRAAGVWSSCAGPYGGEDHRDPSRRLHRQQPPTKTTEDSDLRLCRQSGRCPGGQGASNAPQTFDYWRQEPGLGRGRAGKKYYAELVKALEKTGIPVEHVATGAAPSDNAMVIQGSFTSLKEGTKAERDSIGMGTGNADVQTKVDVHLKTPSDTVLLSQFQTDTQAAKNVGSAVPVAAGMNPRRSGQVHDRGPQEDAGRLRFQDCGCHGEGDLQVDGRTGLDQDQRQGRGCRIDLAQACGRREGYEKHR